VGGELRVGPVEVGLVAVGLRDRGAQVVGDQDRRATVEELKGVDVGGRPGRQRLGRHRLGVRVARRAQDRDEQLGRRDLARGPVDDRDRRAREVEEALLAGPVLAAQDHVEPPGVRPVPLGEPGVGEAVGAALAVLGPEQHERDALAAQLAMDDRPVGDRPGRVGGRRGGPPEQALLEAAVVEIRGQRPAEAGLAGAVEIVADGRPGQADRDADLAGAQVLRFVEPQDFADLAHGSTGTGHRHLSSDVSFEASVRCPTWLTSALAVSSPRGGQNPRNRVAVSRRNQVAKTRGTGWPKPVESARSPDPSGCVGFAPCWGPAITPRPARWHRGDHHGAR
jgi:hypothetical protein